jgi:integrase
MAQLWKKQKTVYRLDGRPVPTGTPGAVRVTVLSRKWYGTVNGRARPLCADKQGAATMLAKLQTDAALNAVGIGDPFAEHRKRSLADHLNDYAAHLRSKGDTEEHVRLTLGRVRNLFDGCGFRHLTDVDAGRAAEWFTTLRQPTPAPVPVPLAQAEFTPAEAAALLGISGAALRAAVKRHGLNVTGEGRARRLPRATVTALVDRMGRGCGPQTVNHYVRAVRGFFRWMTRAKRIGSNPLDTLTLLNAQTDVRRGRRELTADELRGLLAATRAIGRTFRGLTGEDRFHLYLTAATTGFRANALANLTPSDFDLTAGSGTVTLAARFNKSRKPKVQPIPADVVAQLILFLRGKPKARPVWGGTWARDHRGAEMIRGDLVAAGIPYTVEGPDGPEHADFHSLRHSYLTLGGRSGIDLRTLQELAGHSKPELTARYSHRRLYDLAGAVDKFPSLIPAPTSNQAGMLATGTDPVLSHSCTEVARTPCNGGPPLSLVGNDPAGDGYHPEMKQPLVSQEFSRPLASPDASSLERGRRDSNPQPPDRQSRTQAIS